MAETFAKPAVAAQAHGIRVAGQVPRRLLAYLLLISGSVVFVIPLLWMLRTSLLSPDLIFADPPVWIPVPVQWQNYAQMWAAGPFLDWVQNSVIVTAIGVVALTASSTLAAYGFARTKFVGRDKLFILVLATMMIPFQVRLVPEYMLFNWFGWVNTLYPLIIPSLFGSAFYIFILRQFFLTLPRELDEAAAIDGASTWVTLWQIIVPLAQPAIATVAAFAFIDQWNDFLRPTIYLYTPESLTLAVGIRWFVGNYANQYHLMMAASMVALLPMIMVFFIAQKQFMQGIALTGIKG